MKTNHFKLILAITFLLAILFGSCKKDDDDTSITVTQTDVDAVSNFIISATGGFAHGGPDGVSADSTVREVFSDLSSLNGTIPIGTIVTKKTYKKGLDGNKTSTLYVSFVMVKRESGYDADHQDWEYLMIPFDNAVDYTAHPYGILPDEGDTRGKLSMCIGCHASAGGGDYLFSND